MCAGIDPEALQRDFLKYTAQKIKADLRKNHPPVRAGLCSLPEEYKYSSAGLYQTGIDGWGFLTQYRD